MEETDYKESKGWMNPQKWTDLANMEKIRQYASEIREKADIFVLIGVGGSNQAARAVIEGLRPEGGPEILYTGNNLSAVEMNRLLGKLQGKSFYLNVVAKNFETLEPGTAFRILRIELKKRYGAEYTEHIFATGTAGGPLERLCHEKNWRFLEFPEDVGGRYSAITSVGLFPMAVAGVDVWALVNGALDEYREIQNDREIRHPVYAYAEKRNELYQKGYRIELLTYFEPALFRFSRWWIQLFAESEGKDEKGIYPASFQCTEDLHSTGQFVQQGTPIIFETFLEIEDTRNSLMIGEEEDDDGFAYLAHYDLDEINRRAQEAVRKAHEKRNPCLTVRMGKLDAYWFGRLFYFFEYACFLSAQKLGVNPFNQPGVEEYKKVLYSTLRNRMNEKEE